MTTKAEILAHFTGVSAEYRNMVSSLLAWNKALRRQNAILANPLIKHVSKVVAAFSTYFAVTKAKQENIDSGGFMSSAFLYLIGFGSGVMARQAALYTAGKIVKSNDFTESELNLNNYSAGQIAVFIQHLQKEQALLMAYRDGLKKDSLIADLVSPATNLVSRFLPVPTFGLREKMQGFAIAGPVITGLTQWSADLGLLTYSTEAEANLESFLSDPVTYLLVEQQKLAAEQKAEGNLPRLQQ